MYGYIKDNTQAAVGYNSTVNVLTERRTAFDELSSGMGAIKDIEVRLFSLMDRLVGPFADSAGIAQPPREPGLIGDVGEAGRDLSRMAGAMGQYLQAIERALP